MDILSIALLILFIIIPIVFLAIAIIAGFKRNIFQSLAKLGMTVFAIGLTVLIVRLSTSATVKTILPVFAAGDGDLSAFLQSSAIGDGIIKTMCGLISPVIFLVLFSFISLICLILFIIPKHQLSDKKLQERKQKKEATVVTAENTEDQATEITPQVELPAKNAKKAWLRVGSVAISVLSTLLVLAHFALPVSYYSELADDAANNLAFIADIEEIKPVTEGVSNYPTVVCYRFLNAPVTYCLDYVSAANGAAGSSRATLLTALQVANSFNELSSQEPTPETFYAMAELFENNDFLDAILTNILHEMVAAWEKGEAWYGLDSATLGNDASVQMLFEFIKECDSVTDALRLIGDTLYFTNIMGSEEFTADSVKEFLIVANPNSLRAFKDMLADAITGSEAIPAETADNLSSFTGGIIDGIVEIKEDENLSDEEQAAIMTNEAEAVVYFYDLIGNPENAKPEEVGCSIAESKVFSNVIMDITDNGKTKDPCGFGEAIDKDFASGVESGLEQGGASQSSELHKSVMSFFGQ